MKDSQSFTPNPAFTLEDFDNEILLYSVASTKAVYLNKTALLVYHLCAEGLNVGEIVAQLEGAYPEQRGSIRDDVISALSQLVDSEALLPHA